MAKKNKYVKVTTSPSNFTQNGSSKAKVTSTSAKVTSASAKVTHGEDRVKARKQLEEELAHSHNVKATVTSASKDENRSRSVEVKKSSSTPLPKDSNTYRTSTQNTQKPTTTGSKPITYKSTPNVGKGGNKPNTSPQRGTQNSFRTSTETTAKVNTTKANYQSKSAKVEVKTKANVSSHTSGHREVSKPITYKSTPNVNKGGNKPNTSPQRGAQNSFRTSTETTAKVNTTKANYQSKNAKVEAKPKANVSNANKPNGNSASSNSGGGSKPIYVKTPNQPASQNVKIQPKSNSSASKTNQPFVNQNNAPRKAGLVPKVGKVQYIDSSIAQKVMKNSNSSAKVTKVANNSGNFITKPTKSAGISTGGFKVNIKNPMSQMQKVSVRGNEFANTVINKSISAMGRDDSLSNQTITGTMQATVVGVRGVKVAYNTYGTVYNATANSVTKVGKVAYKAGAVAVNKAVIPVAKTSFHLAKGGAKAVKSVDSTIGMIKAGHIPLNGATVKFIATKYAKNTGKFIVNGVKPIGISIKNGFVNSKVGKFSIGVGKATVNVSKSSFQLAKGGAKAVRAIDSTIGMIKAGHIPLNYATVKFIATKYAKNTGKFIAKGVKPIGVSIKKGFKAGVQKFTISNVGAKVVKSAKFVKSSAIKSYKFSKATGNVAIKIGKTGFKTIRSIDSTIGLIKAGHLPLAKAMVKRGFVQSGQALVKGLKATGKGVVWVSKNFKPAIATVKTFKAIKYRGQAVYKLGRAGFRAIRSIDSTIGLIRVGILKFNPRTMINASKIAFSQVKPYFKGGFKLAFRDMKSLSKIMQKGGRKVTSISRIMFKPLKPVGRGFKLLDRPSAMLGGALLGSEDAGAQALGLAVSSVHYTYHGTRFVGKTLKATSKGVGRVGKVGFRGVTGGFRSIKKFNTIRKTQGWRKAFGKGFRSIGNKIANNIAKAGGSAVSAIINGITKLGTKAIIPILLLFLLIGNFNNIASGASAVVGAIFSPFYSNADDYSEQDETVFLQGQISSYRTEWVNDLKAEIRKKLKSHSSEGAWFASYDHDAAKFYYRYPEDSLDEIYQGRVTYIASTWSISHLLWNDADILKYIQPIYHSIIVSEYDLSPWKYQQKDLFKQIWNAMFSYTTESLPLSYCGQFTGADGHEYYPVEADGKCHADPLDCVHMTSKQWHTADTDFDIVCSCDTIYYTCLGHQGTRNCGRTAHTHSTSCESEGSYLSCGTTPHTHTTVCMEFYNGSFTGNYKCGKTAHTHSDSCYTTYTYYSCGMSEHSHTAWSSASSPGCYSTSYHTGHLASACTNSEKHKSCSGFYECLGHTVYKVLLDIGKFDTLLYKYYLKDINRLEAKVTAGTITDAEREELAKLKDYYELCLEYKQSLIDEGLAPP